MKKVMTFLLTVVVIGGITSLYYYSLVQSKVDVKVISVFQTGVFSNYNEALLASDSKSKIFYDGKLYHVYDSIVSDEQSKEKMIDFYTTNNIDYYVKTKYVEDDVYNNINKYSELIKMSDDDTLKVINKQMIEKFGDIIV